MKQQAASAPTQPQQWQHTGTQAAGAGAAAAGWLLLQLPQLPLLATTATMLMTQAAGANMAKITRQQWQPGWQQQEQLQEMAWVWQTLLPCMMTQLLTVSTWGSMLLLKTMAQLACLTAATYSSSSGAVAALSSNSSSRRAGGREALLLPPLPRQAPCNEASQQL
jgi:hypothetical protein